MSTRRCAFLTMENTAGWFIDAELAIAPLRARRFEVDVLPWRSPGVDWSAYDAVYIGTPWDYLDDLQGFLALLERIDDSGAVLVNDLALLRWGLPKTYLRDLEAQGVAIVPSLWQDRLLPGQLSASFAAFASERIVIKPVMSANAADTWLLNRNEAADSEERLLAAFSRRPCVVQPFIPGICIDGEYSLIYLGGRFSHAIRKRPKAGDFRVQEEHGASITALLPEQVLRDCADDIVRLIEPQPVYARCDLVRGPDERFLLMELELIEPSLYLRMDEHAPERFAIEFDRYVARKRTLIDSA